MFERIKTVIVKEFIQLFRDPKMKIVLFIIPMIQMFIFGHAASMDVKNIPVAIYDLDNSKESRELTREFSFSKYFEIKKYIFTDSEQNDTIDKSEVNTVIRFNHGFAKELLRGASADVQFIVDGTDSNTASFILNYATAIIEKYNSREMLGKIQAMLIKIPSVDLCGRAWFNENLDSKNYFVPSIIALILLIVTLILTAMAIVKEKESGTIEQLIVSPLRPIEIILGKLIPFAFVGAVDVFLVTMVAVWWFNVPIRGNFILLFICSCLYLLNTLGLGLFISTIVTTQQEAIMSTFFFAFPAILLSGFVFPIANMPEIVQYFTYLNPLRYYIEIVRGIFLKGVGARILWPQMTILFGLGVFVLVISSLRFKKGLG